MSKSKQPQAPKKNEVAPVRSSAAEYLTFVAAGGQSETALRHSRPNRGRSHCGSG